MHVGDRTPADGGAAAHLNLIMAHVGVGLGILDRDFRYVRVNQQLADINGVSVDDHIGRTMREVLPELAEDVEALLLSIFETGKPIEHIEIKGETRAQPGVERTWEVSYHPSRNPAGDIVGVLFIIRERTESVLMQAALAESEARLNMALDSTDLGVWDWSVETGQIWFSDKWQTMLGFEPGEVHPYISNWQETVHPEDWHNVNAALQPHLDGLTPHYECEHRVRCKDGSWLWIRDRGKVVQRAEDGRPLRMIGTHDNIHSRKEAERFRSALLELSRDVAVLEEPARIIDRTLTVIIETLDVAFAAHTDLGAPHEPPRITRRWQGGSVGMSQGRWIGGRLYAEFGRRVAKGDTVVWPDIRTEPFMQSDGPDNQTEWPDVVAFLGVPIMRRNWLVGTLLVGNRTPRKWSEREIAFLSDARDRTREAIARAKAGEANKQAQEELQRIGRLNTLSALTSTLAHELNQPLAAANNYLTAAKLQARRSAPKDVAAENSPEAIIELAAQQVVRAGEIIRRMRAFTESGEVTAQLASVTKATDSAIETTLSSMGPRALIIRKSYAEGLPDIMLDTVQFQQVISNLVRNAVEAMDRVDQPELGIAIRQQGGNIMIEVTDNGPGFSPGVLETLFQPFRTEKRRGLGLGLPICRTIIEAHGGKIAGEAREDCGARFSITLPAKAQ